MGEVAPSFDEADVRRRATRLLVAFFTEHPNLRQAVLDQAFGGLEHDPRRLIELKGPAATFAVECVSQLLAYGCTDNGRHSLAQLLEVLRDSWLGANPDPDYIELPPILNAPCALPSRQQELDHLDTLLAEIRRRAARYAPLRGIARVRTKSAASPLFDARDEDYFVPLRHLSRHGEAAQASEVNDYPDILSAFAQGEVRQAAVLGAPGAGKTTTIMRHAADLARKAQSDLTAPIPLLVGLGDWRSDTEALETYIARKLPAVGAGLRALSKAGRAVLLLDGLNEVPTRQRDDKAGQVRALLRTLKEDKTPVYVSCRSDDYTEALDLGLDTLTLLPLTPPRIRDVLDHWLSLLFADAGRQRADRLFGQLAGDPRLLALYQQWVEAGEDEAAFWCEPDAPQAAQTAERIQAVLDLVFTHKSAEHKGTAGDSRGVMVRIVAQW